MTSRWHRPAEIPWWRPSSLDKITWWKVLLMEAKAQRTARLASKEHHQHLVAGLDWHTYRQVIRTIPGERKPHLRTWTQAAIHFKEDGKPKMCPICKVPATTKHILWLRKWHQTQTHKPMPPEWAERILCEDARASREQTDAATLPGTRSVARSATSCNPSASRVGLHTRCHTLEL